MRSSKGFWNVRVHRTWEPLENRDGDEIGRRLRIRFDHSGGELVDDTFATEEEAEHDSWLGNWRAGTETLMFAGQD